MSEELFFETDAAIITRLGRELVAKQETALIELVKNGFDADATEVEVVFERSGKRLHSGRRLENGRMAPPGAEPKNATKPEDNMTSSQRA